MYEILDSALSKVGEVEKVSSDNHSIHWQGAGTLTLIAAATKANLLRLKNDRFVLIRDTSRHGNRLDGLYMICSVQHDEAQNEITVNGKAAPYLLHQRALQARVLTDTTAGAALTKIINDNARELPIQAAYTKSGDPEVVRYPVDGGAVDERCEDLMSYCGIGMQAVLDSGKICITFSSGRDLTGTNSVPVLGTDSGYGINPSLTADSSDFCNVAIGKLAYSDGREASFTVGNTDATGAKRRELFIGEISQNSDESDEDFQARAKEQAKDTLNAHLLRTTISLDINPADYGKYLVGDAVRVQVGSTVLTKRISAATWLTDQSNNKLSLTLGDQLHTIVAEIKEKNKENAARAAGASVRAGAAARTAAANKEAIVGIKTDFKSLIARVDDVVAGMDAYVLKKVFEDYETASARLFAALQGEDKSIKSELSLQASSINGLQDASTELATRISDAEDSIDGKASKQELEAGLSAKVSNADLTERLKNYALASSLNDYLTVNAAAETYVTSGGVTSIIGNYIVTDQDGNKKSLAQILADQISLQGRVDLTGSLSVENGVITSTGQIISQKNIRANTGLSSTKLELDNEDIKIAQKPYTPTPITSTSGTVLVLGTA